MPAAIREYSDGCYYFKVEDADLNFTAHHITSAAAAGVQGLQRRRTNG